jgi:hypothetical protein
MVASLASTQVLFELRPVKPNVYVNTLLERSLKSRHGFLELHRTGFPNAKAVECITKIVMVNGPAEWHSLASVHLQSRPISIVKVVRGDRSAHLQRG